MALLSILVHNDKSIVKETVSKELKKIAKREAIFEDWYVVDEFIERVFSLYGYGKVTFMILKTQEARKVLEELEKKYYEIFKKACYKYLNKNIIEKYKKYGKYIATFLRKN